MSQNPDKLLSEFDHRKIGKNKFEVQVQLVIQRMSDGIQVRTRRWLGWDEQGPITDAFDWESSQGCDCNRHQLFASVYSPADTVYPSKCPCGSTAYRIAIINPRNKRVLYSELPGISLGDTMPENYA